MSAFFLFCASVPPSSNSGYSAAGNRLALAQTVGLSRTVHSYTYSAANRLTSVTSGTLITTFEYDGLGNRMAQTVDGVTTEYVLDVAGGLPEVIVATTGGASTRYVQVQGQILAEYEAGAWAYVLPDHLGSVRQLVGSGSQVDLAQSYDPFGVPFEASGSGESDFGYTGEWWDSEAGVLYLRARYYDPVVGRFVSKDPWQGDSSRPQSLNAWSYVGNSPINFTDPSGFLANPRYLGTVPNDFFNGWSEADNFAEVIDRQADYWEAWGAYIGWVYPQSVLYFLRQGVSVPTSVEAVNACALGGIIEFEAGFGTLRRFAHNIRETAAEARRDSPPSELLELVWVYPDIRIWVLSLNFRDEWAFSGLDVVAIAKKHLDVVSGGSIRASIARENCHFRS